jgi:hypothetical protein
MANEKQLAILRQGVDVWNRWMHKHPRANIDLKNADLRKADLKGANLVRVNMRGANLRGAELMSADLSNSDLRGTSFKEANLIWAKLTEANVTNTNFSGAILAGTALDIIAPTRSIFSKATVGGTSFRYSDLSETLGLEDVIHIGPSVIWKDTFVSSKGRIPETFLRGCGLNDWEIEFVKLYNPELTNDEIVRIQYNMYDLRASKAIQLSPLFISYSQADSEFVDKVESHLNKKGIRFWRDIRDMKAGRMERQIDIAIRQNPTVLLVLSENSLSSDWVEHEVRTSRDLEKEMDRDVLCPVALDDSWKSSRWPKRIMEQIIEYNILDFSAWKDDSKFESMFSKLIDGLELIYKE